MRRRDFETGLKFAETHDFARTILYPWKWRSSVKLFFLLNFSFQVQGLASQIGVGYNLFVSIPSLLVAPLWGPWTDKGGKRKPSLLVAIIGACLEMSTVLVVMYFELSVYFLYVAAAISGFSGFATVLMVGATSYVADISTKEERAFRIGENAFDVIHYN